MEIRPQAMAIPKDTEKLEQGKYGPIYPKTPACHGFTIIAKIIPGRESAFYEYGSEHREGGCRSARLPGPAPVALPPLGLYSQSRVETYFMYQGIFDTDFDKYTDDAVALFTRWVYRRFSRTSRAFLKIGRRNPEAFIKFVRAHQCPSFLEYGEYPYFSADEIKKALKIKAPCPTCWIRCSNKVLEIAGVDPERGHSMGETKQPARTYNQNHIPRKYTPGKRRVSIYWSWSYPWESQRNTAEMENRFSTMTEVRNVLWPAYETPEWSAAQFLQGIAGTLELFHRSAIAFQELTEEVTGHPVAVFQRIDQAGYKLPVDERILADTDTLLVFGLDHLPSEQAAEPARSTRSGVAETRRHLPHDRATPRRRFHRRSETASDGIQHHGDTLVPRQQRFSQYTRSLLQAFDVPVINQWGLRPALVKGTRDIAPLTAFRDLDKRGLLKNVPTLNFHPHLPHYALTRDDGKGSACARASADRSRSAPSVHSGGQYGIQLPAVAAAQRETRRRHPDGRFDELHDVVRRYRQPAKLLEEHRHGLAIEIGKRGYGDGTASLVLELDDIQSGVLRPRPSPYVATYIGFASMIERQAGS